MYNYYYKDRIYQGDIFNDIKIKLDVELIEDEINVTTRSFPYVVVMTQDCDLEQDYNTRKSSSDNQSNCLLSILLCPAFLSDDIREGTHLENAGLSVQRLNKSLWKPITKNEDKRYHYLDGEDVNTEYKGVVSINDLVIDFKHYQTIQRDDLYKKIKNHYYLSIDPLFREKISHRFTHYLSRIGLPENDLDTDSSCGSYCD